MKEICNSNAHADRRIVSEMTCSFYCSFARRLIQDRKGSILMEAHKFGDVQCETIRTIFCLPLAAY